MAIRTPPSADHRYKKWALRFAAGSQSLSPVMERLMTDVEQVIPNSTALAFNEMVAMETEVRAVLNVAGVSMIHYPFYLCFGRELWKLSGRVSGESANVECAVLVSKWVARGLTQSVLFAIRTGVFNFTAPIAP